MRVIFMRGTDASETATSIVVAAAVVVLFTARVWAHVKTTHLTMKRGTIF